MSVVEYGEEKVDELIEEVRSYDAQWTEKLDTGDVEEDENFLYLEIQSSEDIGSEFHEMGAMLSAHTAEVNGGESYRLALEK